MCVCFLSISGQGPGYMTVHDPWFPGESCTSSLSWHQAILIVVQTLLQVCEYVWLIVKICASSILWDEGEEIRGGGGVIWTELLMCVCAYNEWCVGVGVCICMGRCGVDIVRWNMSHVIVHKVKIVYIIKWLGKEMLSDLAFYLL